MSLVEEDRCDLTSEAVGNAAIPDGEMNEMRKVRCEFGKGKPERPKPLETWHVGS